MDDQPSVKQTPEQKDSLCEMANRCQEVSDRLAGHGIIFGINYQRNVEQPDGSSVDGLEIMRSLGAELATGTTLRRERANLARWEGLWSSAMVFRADQRTDRSPLRAA